MRVSRSVLLSVLVLALGAGTGCHRPGGTWGGVSIVLWIFTPAPPPEPILGWPGLPGGPCPESVPPLPAPPDLVPPPSWDQPIGDLLPPPPPPPPAMDYPPDEVQTAPPVELTPDPPPPSYEDGGLFGQ